ncbi:hypothetical protein COO60DRAFT_1514140 [Scenedesmus sp. NREL 46B-D3]|nr:hypothetical protein COO60DRAFT_1514140 [Scenedesmus sp. NREL 46B-D3]
MLMGPQSSTLWWQLAGVWLRTSTLTCQLVGHGGSRFGWHSLLQLRQVSSKQPPQVYTLATATLPRLPVSVLAALSYHTAALEFAKLLDTAHVCLSLLPARASTTAAQQVCSRCTAVQLPGTQV